MRYSISLYAEGDREVSLEEVVELADAVATLEGIASGYGTMGYGAQIVVEADNSDAAVDAALEKFAAAVATTSLPTWPVVKAESVSEDDDYAELEDQLRDPTRQPGGLLLRRSPRPGRLDPPAKPAVYAILRKSTRPPARILSDFVGRSTT